ncbi:MAG: glycosyltransferase [Gemmatimonadota bacterium]
MRIGLVTAAYLAILATLVPFGLHRLWLLWLRARLPLPPSARERRTPAAGTWPIVTVQLPIYDEANVVERLIDAACGLDYPRDRLEVQVLDDSDDLTTGLAARRVARWRAAGIDIHHLRRGTRSGFKAGALGYGAARARGDLFLILDADFVPPRELLRRLVPTFDDRSVGAVQAAWGHLNADESWLTRAQALFLDAHFAIEHAARHRAGLFFNFNGSAGMWRRACLEAAGGWQADTLTEDVDLSYRAQLAGWRLAYRDDVRVPAELPRRLDAVEVQQERWAQGGIQSARKLLPAVWRSGFPRRVKWEATAHLLSHIVHPLTLSLGVCLAALGYAGVVHASIPAWIHGAALGLATLPFILFYGAAARLRGVATARLPARIVEALLLGLGLGVPLAGAVLRGLIGSPTPFRRTPKRGWTPVRWYAAGPNRGSTLLRAGLGLLLAGAAANLVGLRMPGAVPFTALFAAGYLATSGEALRGARLRDQ